MGKEIRDIITLKLPEGDKGIEYIELWLNTINNYIELLNTSKTSGFGIPQHVWVDNLCLNSDNYKIIEVESTKFLQIIISSRGGSFKDIIPLTTGYPYCVITQDSDLGEDLYEYLTGNTVNELSGRVVSEIMTDIQDVINLVNPYKLVFASI